MEVFSRLSFNDQFLKIFEAAVSSMDEGISVSDATDPEMPLIFVNRGFCKMTGYEPGEVLGKNCRFLQGDDTSPGAVQHIRNALEKREKVVVLIKNYRKDGAPFWNRLALSPVFDHSGNLTNYVGIQSNIGTYSNTRDKELKFEAMKATLETINDVVFNFFCYLKLLKTQLESVPGMEATLAEFDSCYNATMRKLEKINKMDAYKEILLGDSVKLLDWNTN